MGDCHELRLDACGGRTFGLGGTKMGLAQRGPVAPVGGSDSGITPRDGPIRSRRIEGESGLTGGRSPSPAIPSNSDRALPTLCPLYGRWSGTFQLLSMSPNPSKPIKFKARQALAIVFAGVLVGVGGGVGICASAGWALGGMLAAGTSAALVWLVAALLGVQALVVGTGLSVDRLGFGVLASSMARMLFALLVGLLVYFLGGLDGRQFWVCFLGAGLVALAAEALWAVHVINCSAKATSAGPESQGAA